MSNGKDAGGSIPILSWFDKPARQAIESVYEGLNSYGEALDLFKKYRRNHSKRLRADVSPVKLLGMSATLKLRDIYSPALVSTTIHGRLFEKEWIDADREGETLPPDPQERIRRLPTEQADHYVEENDRVVLLGSPGSGKTTFLRFLALAYCTRDVFRKSNLKTSKHPFYVSLPAFVEDMQETHTILDYIARDLEEHTDSYAIHFLRRILDRGDAIVLLDSLDEVPVSSRSKVLDQIKILSRAFPGSKIVVSCRTADYRSPVPGYNEVELTRLTEAAIERIVDAWFRTQPQRAAQLKKLLQRDRGVKSLCETPLLLSLVCIQFGHDLALPKRRTELYRRCIEAFLRDWDTSRGFRRVSAYESLSDDRKEAIFESVAWKFFREGGYSFPESDLVHQIEHCCELFEIDPSNASDVLREIEAHHGILERFSAESYMFSHPSIHEYFTARSVISQEDAERCMTTNFNDARWSSVLEFVVAMHPSPVDLLMFLVDKSTVDSSQYYPSVARRIKVLNLLYRCLCAGAAVTLYVRRECYRHVARSHVHVIEAFTRGGVYPLAVLVPDGIRYTYVYFRKRPTTDRALIPLRFLSNDVLLSPVNLYGQIAVEEARAIEFSGHGFEAASKLLALVMPVATLDPDSAYEVLDRIAKHDFPPYMSQLVEQSREVLGGLDSGS